MQQADIALVLSVALDLHLYCQKYDSCQVLLETACVGV